MRTAKRWFAAALLIVLTACGWASACTLWSAAGNTVFGEGTILSKNRDYVPQAQKIKVLKPRNGYGYVALFAQDHAGDEDSIRAGTNQYGLTVVSATASSIPATKRSAIPKQPRQIERLLASSKTVEEALSHKEWLYGPRFLMLSDRREVAYVEIGPGKQISTRKSSDGVLYHTNHYVSEELSKANVRIGESSKIRYGRIAELLKTAQYPLTVKQFEAFSGDHAAGSDNSIFRTGLSEKTVASWIVRTPAQGSPVVYVKLWNPKEREKSYEVNVDDVLSGKATIK